MSPPSKEASTQHVISRFFSFPFPLPFSIVGIVPSRNRDSPSFFFFFSTPFQFLFSQFPTCGEGEEEGPRRSIWFIGGRRSLPRAEDCNFEAGGRAFRTAFRRRLSPCLLLLLLLNVPPLLSRLSRLSRLTRLRESHSLIDNRRLATSVSGECFCQTASRRMSIASSIPSLTRRGRIHDRKLWWWVGIYPNDFAVHCSLVRCS